MQPTEIRRLLGSLEGCTLGTALMARLRGTAFQAEGGGGTYRGLKPPVIEIQASSLTDWIGYGRLLAHSKLVRCTGETTG